MDKLDLYFALKKQREKTDKRTRQYIKALREAKSWQRKYEALKSEIAIFNKEIKNI